jgi:plastocyanin
MAAARSRRLLLLLLAALAVTVAGTALSPIATAAPPATHTVTIDGSRFDPSTLAVKAGDTIVWVNKDPFPHTSTSKAGEFDSQTIAAGKSWTLTAAKKGTFAYTCTFHPTMKGTLRVN